MTIIAKSSEPAIANSKLTLSITIKQIVFDEISINLNIIVANRNKTYIK
jgi:hypothetical protein